MTRPKLAEYQTTRRPWGFTAVAWLTCVPAICFMEWWSQVRMLGSRLDVNIRIAQNQRHLLWLHLVSFIGQTCSFLFSSSLYNVLGRVWQSCWHHSGWFRSHDRQLQHSQRGQWLVVRWTFAVRFFRSAPQNAAMHVCVNLHSIGVIQVDVCCAVFCQTTTLSSSTYFFSC